MKHTLKVTLILIAVFLFAQIFGLFTVNHYIEVIPGEEPQILHDDTLLGPAPEMDGAQGFISVIIAVIIGTILLLILAKFRQVRIWKLWFFVSIAATTALALEVYIPGIIAIVVGIILALLKIYKPNVFIHNLSEILMYTGIAIIFVSFFDLLWAFLLLIVISIYDMYAVWKSKHMVTLAKFTMETNLFAGLNIHYKPAGSKILSGPPPPGTKVTKIRQAILGGGDIAFPLIFASVAMEHLIAVKKVMQMQAFWLVLFIPIGAAIALFYLFYRSDKDKFYPAMPFVSAGAFIGYGIILLLI